MAFDPASYLAALIDGEGTINAYKTKSGYSCRIAVCNTELDIIEAAKECFSMLSIPSTLSVTAQKGNRKTRYDLYVRGGYASYKRLAELVPLKSARKQAALASLLYTRKWKPMPNKEWFYLRYHEQNQSIAEIAQELKCSPMTAYNWLRRHQIPRRSLSLAGKIFWEGQGHRRR